MALVLGCAGRWRGWLAAVLTVLTVLRPACAERILVLPFNTHSHVKLMTLSCTDLLRAGHEVWMVSSLPPTRYNASHGAITWIQVHLPSVKDLVANVSCANDARRCYQVFFRDTHQRALGHCRAILKNDTLIEELRILNFSLSIYDGVQSYRCASFLPHMLGVPYMSLSIQHSAWLAGVPSLPSLEPHQLSSFTGHMSFHQRFTNTMLYIVTAAFSPFLERRENYLLREVMPHSTYTSLHQVLTNSVLWLTITQPTCLDYPRLTAPHYIEINMPSPFYDNSRVSADLQSFADGAKQGLVLVTFGCLMSEGMLPAVMRDMFIQTFRAFPNHSFVLKYTPDANFNTTFVADNIFLMEWVPLDELLRHANTRLLITHSGAVSMNEAVLHGVPVLVLPYLADQGYNAQRATQHGWGMSIEKSRLSTKSLSEALTTLLKNGSYASAARFCKDILRSIPSGEKSIAFWVEHVFSYGWRHLHMRRKKPSLVVLLMLDVLAVLLVLLGLLVYTAVQLLFACAFIWNRAKKKYPSFFYYIGPCITGFFMPVLLHSIYTTQIEINK